jgi:formyltetrahydrofolate-dependent phosphoribosylglycinamide formyltransferase
VKPARIAVLLSGSGRTLENFHQEREAGRLPVDFALVVSSRADAGGIEKARRRGLPTAVVDRRQYRDDRSFSSEVTRRLHEAGADLVAMAGFVHLYVLPPEYEGKVLNIHPALLPLFGGKGFYGMRVHRAVWESGMRVTGCTVHYATAEYDAGPIILQRVVPVLDDDTPETIADRVFAEECVAYPESIRLHVSGRLRIVGRRVIQTGSGLVCRPDPFKRDG